MIAEIESVGTVGRGHARPADLKALAMFVLGMLAAGRFLTVLPESMIRFRAKNLALKVLPVELPARQLSVVIVTMKNRTLSPLAKLFIDSARAMSRPLA